VSFEVIARPGKAPTQSERSLAELFFCVCYLFVSEMCFFWVLQLFTEICFLASYRVPSIFCVSFEFIVSVVLLLALISCKRDPASRSRRVSAVFLETESLSLSLSLRGSTSSSLFHCSKSCPAPQHPTEAWLQITERLVNTGVRFPVCILKLLLFG